MNIGFCWSGNLRMPMLLMSLFSFFQYVFGPVCLGLQNTPTASLQRSKTPWTSVLNKQSDGEVPLMLELWGMQSTSSLLSLPDPLWSGVVAPGRVLSMGQKELNCVIILKWSVWNRTVLTFKLRTYTKLNCWKLLSKWLNSALNDLKRVKML